MLSLFSFSAGALLLTNSFLAHALSLNSDPSKHDDSLKDAATTIASDLFNYYDGQAGTGLFPASNYWFESAAAWSAYIDWWEYSGGKSQYVGDVQQALVAQAGKDEDFMSQNEVKSEGNDDQAFWALAAMNAAEKGFPDASSNTTSYLTFAQNAFDKIAARWDTSSCGGGFRWQIFTFNDGYDYKNSISQGTFFQLAARLAHYTGNSTYADWAGKSYNWAKFVGLISPDFKVYDGTLTSKNCSNINHLQWSADAATFVYGSAVMYNYTNGSVAWKTEADSLVKAMSVFWTPPSNTTVRTSNAQKILYEVACENQGTCNGEQGIYKGLAAQWLSAAETHYPDLIETTSPVLQASANGAVAACSGGKNGTACGLQWTSGKYDYKTSFRQELAAFDVVLANLATANRPAKANINYEGSAASSSGGGPAPTGSGAPSSSKTKSAGVVLRPVGSLMAVGAMCAALALGL